jgi:hypothetical protein
MDEQTKAFISAFFKDVIINGISRHVEIPELQDVGRLEIDLVSADRGIPTVHLSFPEDWETINSVDKCMDT